MKAAKSKLMPELKQPTLPKLDLYLQKQNISFKGSKACWFKYRIRNRYSWLGYNWFFQGQDRLFNNIFLQGNKET